MYKSGWQISLDTNITCSYHKTMGNETNHEGSLILSSGKKKKRRISE